MAVTGERQEFARRRLREQRDLRERHGDSWFATYPGLVLVHRLPEEEDVFWLVDDVSCTVGRDPSSTVSVADGFTTVSRAFGVLSFDRSSATWSLHIDRRARSGGFNHEVLVPGRAYALREGDMITLGEAPILLVVRAGAPRERGTGTVPRAAS